MIDQVSLAKLMESAEARRSEIAALCFLVWDVLITTDEEVEHIWRTPFRPLKLLYLFTRYYSVIALIILNSRSLTCQDWVIIEAVSAVLLEFAVEGILMLRLYAMYIASKTLVRILIPAFVLQAVIMTVSLSVSLPQVIETQHCIETSFPLAIIAYSISSVVFEGFLFGLTVYKYWLASKEGWNHASLLRVMVRDNMWTFALVFLANTANTLFFTLAPATLAALGFPWLLAIFGSVGPRLVLNIRQEHARSTSARSLDSFTIPTIVYSPVSTVDVEFASARVSTSSVLRSSKAWSPLHSTPLTVAY